MLESPILNNQVVSVMVAQTTFAVLTILGRYYRVDYLEKAEARLRPSMRGEAASYSEHPLLLKYNSSQVSVYINSKPQNPQGLLLEIRERVEAQLQGWRDPSLIIYPRLLQQNLIDGSGMILQAAPEPIATAVIKACTEQNVLTWAPESFGGLRGKSPYHLLLIGDGYVIARNFRFTEVFYKNIPTSKSIILIPIKGTTTPPSP
jgi:hypothetical protein